MIPFLRSAALITTLTTALISGCSTTTQPSLTKGIDTILTGFDTPESVIHDSERNMLYVSNVQGAPNEHDGKGFISKVSLDGTMIDTAWVTGLNAPKGMVINQNTLYVSDITTLVAIDIPTSTIVARYPNSGALFLNDLAIDQSGQIYVSDMMGNAIYRLEHDSLTLFLQDPLLDHPNGLHIDGAFLYSASWGTFNGNGFETSIPGTVKKISLTTQEIAVVTQTPFGNLDGLEPASNGAFYTNDYFSGTVYEVSTTGDTTSLFSINTVGADFEFIPERNQFIIPMMMENSLRFISYIK
ncbi:MAG: hypothetical protein OCC49_14995 [Fibrobacterales bacterium]